MKSRQELCGLGEGEANLTREIHKVVYLDASYTPQLGQEERGIICLTYTYIRNMSVCIYNLHTIIWITMWVLL